MNLSDFDINYEKHKKNIKNWCKNLEKEIDQIIEQIRRQQMKPLKFKVKKLRNIPNDTRIIEMRKVGSDGDDYQITWEDMGEAVWELKPLAYQLTPCGDYSSVDEPAIYRRIKGSLRDKYIYVDVEHYEQFKQAVHEYNLKYCDVPDVKVLDGFEEYVAKEQINLRTKVAQDVFELVHKYKSTLVSPESWFEMEVNDGNS